MKKVYKIILLGLLAIGCTNKNGEILSENDKQVLQDQKMVKELTKKCLENGDEKAYARLIDYYFQQESSYELLPLSIFMADKYNSIIAYPVIYRKFIELKNGGKFNDTLFENLNEGDSKLVLYYMEEGAKNNNISSIRILEKLYRNGIGVNKDIKKADSLSLLNNKKYGGAGNG